MLLQWHKVTVWKFNWNKTKWMKCDDTKCLRVCVVLSLNVRKHKVTNWNWNEKKEKCKEKRRIKSSYLFLCLLLMRGKREKKIEVEIRFIWSLCVCVWYAAQRMEVFGRENRQVFTLFTVVQLCFSLFFSSSIFCSFAAICNAMRFQCFISIFFMFSVSATNWTKW